MFKNRIDDCDTLRAELDSLRPIETKNIDKIRSFWRVGLTYSSNAVEGNTLTESETKVILEDGLTVSGKPLREHYEAVGHAEAFDFLMGTYNKGVSKGAMKELHRLFYHRIDSGKAGVYRAENVLITGTDYVPPSFEEVPERMRKFLVSIKENRHPILQAVDSHMGLVDVHPFVDGNGRIARLVMNLFLLKNGYPVVGVPPIYRSQYIEACASGNKGNREPIVNLISEICFQTLSDYLRMLKKLS